MSAHIVYAYGIQAYDGTPMKMNWRCSCGGGSQNYSGEKIVCPYCRARLTIPEEPVDLTGTSAEPAEDADPPISTAWTLAAYREELHACGFAPSVAAELVLIAARNPHSLTVDPRYIARAEPPVPIVWIENHEPGSQCEAEAYARCKRETST